MNKFTIEEQDDGFISDDNCEERWEVAPLNSNDDLEEMDIFEEDDDEEDASFYTKEDYENYPVLRMIMRHLGGEDPLGRDYHDLEE